jgi:transcriptional regulator with PAS, ATPase and Fis domain
MIGSRCGTLFLDEIGDMPPFASVKLSILWERSIERIGGREKIAATHGLCRDKS